MCKDNDLCRREPQAEKENACGWYRCRGICGLGKKEPELCSHHEARDDRTSPIIIEEPTYNKIDKAAIAAAKIISHCRKQRDDREYGIGIYKRIDVENGKKVEKFCLVETREGVQLKGNEQARVEVDNRIGIGTEPEPKRVDGDFKIYRIFNGKRYTFEASVHSHPTSPKHYDQSFSIDDYIESYGGRNRRFFDKTSDYRQYVIYIVAEYRNFDNYEMVKKLIKFDPPSPNDDITSELKIMLKNNKDIRSADVKDCMTQKKLFIKIGIEEIVTLDIDNEKIEKP